LHAFYQRYIRADFGSEQVNDSHVFTHHPWHNEIQPHGWNKWVLRFSLPGCVNPCGKYPLSRRVDCYYNRSIPKLQTIRHMLLVIFITCHAWAISFTDQIKQLEQIHNLVVNEEDG